MSSVTPEQKQVKAFQFIEGKPAATRTVSENEAATENKENVSSGKPGKTPAPQRRFSPTKDLKAHSPSKFPSTPASRLALADLIGDADDSIIAAPEGDSPQEQVKWNASRSPHRPSSGATPGLAGRKRARSSSPPSASQLGAKRTKSFIDPIPPRQTLRTPRADPAADLWNRFNVDSRRDTGLTNPLATVLESSSPYTDGTGNVGGLRRWTSCGVEWPSSKRKRRKVPTTMSNMDVFTDFQEDDAEASNSNREDKPSKMGSLLVRIQESLARTTKSEVEQERPSSSSPLPEKTALFNQNSISPCRAPDIAQRQASSPTHGRKPSGSSVRRRQNVQSKSPSTSFGSDSTEMEMLAKALPVVDSEQTESGILGLAQPPKDESSRKAAIDEDDFGDDFNLSAEDFDDVALKSQAPGAAQNSANKASISGVGDDDDDEDDIDEDLFAAAEASATQATNVPRTSAVPVCSKQAKIQRYRVEGVSTAEYVNAHGHRRPEQVVTVQDEESKAQRVCFLRESWLDTRCTKGSFVHIIGAFDKHGQCIVDDSQNILILHPDHLISALVVADSYSCMRKAVLQDRVKATSESSPPMLYGTIIHEIFQAALQANRFDEAFLSELIGVFLVRHVEDLYKTGLTVPQANDHLTGRMHSIQSWGETFVRLKPDDTTTVRDLKGKRVQMSVNKLLDVEEHIWSPMYGLKGNIDATVQIAMNDDAGERTLTVPLEVKTGKRETASHRAQTALYTLMLSDRYDVSVVYGVLYYVESGEMARIPAIRHELRHLIMQRNELACYVRERLTLPPMLRNTHACSNCYAKTTCFLYHKLAEGGDGETSGLRDKFDALTKHLQPAHQAFFKKWDDLLTKEESEMMKFRRELWTMLSKEREKLGRCFANVTLIHSSAATDPTASKINRFTYTFKKIEENAKFSFSESQISIGEPIVVSDENGHYALARGYVTAISRSRITVAVDRRLHNARQRQPAFDKDTNQVFAGVMSLAPTPSDQTASECTDGLQYRLDKDEFSNGMATCRNNLIQLMTHDVFRSRGLQSLIVEQKPPSFKALPSSYTITGPPSQASVNGDQRAAIDKILSAEDYALVLGMPGTGKTTTIAHIIRALVAKGKSVLLASYTHTAVDNILLKIKSPKIPVLRLGALAKVHPEVKEFAQLAEEPSTSIEELHSKWHDPQVVATTCLGVGHPLFQQRIFDYCIVDEASQITLPVCLGPVRMARTFVLVGDHYQLPPLVQNDEAKEGGLDISLFKLLCEAHPNSVAVLSEQYRMNEAIMSLSSKLIYGGRLRCGSAAVAQQRLVLPRFDALAQLHHRDSSAQSSESPSCRGLASPNCVVAMAFAPAAPPVTFLNTDSLHPLANEIRKGPRITNPLEASLSVELVRALLHAGLAPSSIGVITLYRSQLALIRQELTLALGPQAAQIEAHTADKYQGRDKEVIIVSFARSNDSHEIGELLKDSRRVNVSITRAKRKLVLLGSRRTLERGDELLRKLVGLCAEGGGMVDVAHGWQHRFDTTALSQPPVGASAHVDDTADTAPKRKVLGEVSVNVDTTSRAGKKAVNPNYKTPMKAGKVVQGQRRMTHGMLKKQSIMHDIMHEVIGEELGQ